MSTSEFLYSRFLQALRRLMGRVVHHVCLEPWLVSVVPPVKDVRRATSLLRRETANAIFVTQGPMQQPGAMNVVVVHLVAIQTLVQPTAQHVQRAG